MDLNERRAKGIDLQKRQGDLYFAEISRAEFDAAKLAKDNKPYKTNVLAHGEATGHRHCLTPVDGSMEDVEMTVTPQGDIFISSTKEINIGHEEHGRITLPPGEYCMTRQEEHDWATQERRRIAD